MNLKQLLEGDGIYFEEGILPNEIWAGILRYCAGYSWKKRARLMMVCKFWRLVILSQVKEVNLVADLMPFSYLDMLSGCGAYLKVTICLCSNCNKLLNSEFDSWQRHKGRGCHKSHQKVPSSYAIECLSNQISKRRMGGHCLLIRFAGLEFIQL